MKKLLFFLILGVIFLSNGCNKSDNQTKASKVPIKASLDLTKVVDDKVPVEINPGIFTQDSIIYRIPRTVQGTYHIQDFGNFVVDFKALDYEGNELPITRLDANSWTIKNVKNLDKITYKVNDTFDDEKGEFPIPFHPSGTNFEKDNFLLNLHALIGYFDSLKKNEYILNVTYASDFKSSSALEIVAEEVHENNTSTRKYFAKRYFDITDNPMFYGDLDIEKFNIDDMTVVITVYSPNKTHTAAQVLEYVSKTMRFQKNFLGEMNTSQRYDVFLFLSRNDETSPTYNGALEHHTSTIVVTEDSSTSEKLKTYLTNTISHEFFHTVTPLNLHSEDVHYFDYNTPTFSKHLWMYEGLTEYFTFLFQINQGLIEKKDYYKIISNIFQETLAYDDALSLTKTSENILDFPYRDCYRNFYDKGVLVNMCIDILIREGSNGDNGILAIMKEFSLKYGKDKPFNDNTIIDEIISMTYPSVGDFFNEHVRGIIPINYSELFNKVGLILNESKVETNYYQNGNSWIFGWNVDDESAFFRGGVENNSFWDGLEVQPYDILKSVDGEVITDKNADAVFEEKIMKMKPGDDFDIILIRDGEEVNIKGTMTQSYTSEFSLSEDENATEVQKALRESLLKG